MSNTNQARWGFDGDPSYISQCRRCLAMGLLPTLEVPANIVVGGIRLEETTEGLSIEGSGDDLAELAYIIMLGLGAIKPKKYCAGSRTFKSCYRNQNIVITVLGNGATRTSS